MNKKKDRLNAWKIQEHEQLKAINLIENLSDYLSEAHQNDIEIERENGTNHYKDEPDCSYCKAIKEAREFLKIKAVK